MGPGSEPRFLIALAPPPPPQFYHWQHGLNNRRRDVEDAANEAPS